MGLQPLTVKIPRSEDLDIDPERWALDYAFFNPHASVKFSEIINAPVGINHDKRQDLKGSDFYRSTNPGWKRFLPTDPTSPYWYDIDSFARLVQLTIHQSDRPLRDFVREFRGLTGNAKAKNVCDQIGVKRLSELDGDKDRIERLFSAMLETAGKVNPEVLGIICEDHIKRCMAENFEVKPGRFWYKRVSGELDGAPFIVEAALGQVSENPQMITGINFSPTYGDPISDFLLSVDKPFFHEIGLSSFLDECEAAPHHFFTSVLHIVCPTLALNFLDRGKTRLSYRTSQRSLADACSKALWSVCKVAYKEKKARERNRAKAEREAERSPPHDDKKTIQDWVFEAIPEAVKIATGNGVYPVSARNLYYKVRSLLSGKMEKDLDYTYFSQTLLITYQVQHGPIEALYYDPRGWLYEPHTRQQTQLGTREVEKYSFPDWIYNKILFVEKKGLWPIIREAKIAERYDMAVICSEGLATTAVRTLLADAQARGEYKIFVLHDCDIDGYNIARTLAEATKRMPDHSLEVFDIGLKFEQAQALDLLHETYTRKKGLPSELALTDDERDFFIKRRWGNKQFECRRYELNELSAPQLIALIEQGLAENGADEKLIPLGEFI